MARSDPKQAEKLLVDTEQRLGVRFPESYRYFILHRHRALEPVKRLRFHSVSKCGWLDAENGERTAVVIGFCWSGDGTSPLCFRVNAKGKIASDAVYEKRDGRFVRSPDFSELVEYEREDVQKSTEARAVFAEQLTGVRRLCPRDGNQLVIGETCPKCRHIGAPSDARFVLPADQREALREQFPDTDNAFEILRELKQADAAVPTGSAQVLKLAALLEGKLHAQAAAEQLSQAWKTAGYRVSLPTEVIRDAINEHA